MNLNINLKAQCKCGKVHLEAVCSHPNGLWGRFCCHCSMCPEKDRDFESAELGTGVNWVATPRVAVLSDMSDISIVQSSAFAERWRCKHCDTGLVMRYVCEQHTDWIRLNSLDVTSQRAVIDALPLPHHIHCSFVGEGHPLGLLCPDGSRAFQLIEPWECDPYRPIGTKSPPLCQVCWVPLLVSEEGSEVATCMCSTNKQKAAE
jgi:hypothetical protein